MCPETSEMKDIRLYRCLDFPLKWELEKTLIKDVSAVDSNIFEFNEKWWMLTNIDSSNSGEHCSELHLFYSSDLRANWKPHPLNPIIFDSKTAITRATSGTLRDICRSSTLNPYAALGIKSLVSVDIPAVLVTSNF